MQRRRGAPIAGGSVGSRLRAWVEKRFEPGWQLRWATLASVGGIGLWLTMRIAWMSDDGLINVRTALNMSAGNGPVFNSGERVQAYTSPAWFWLEYLAGRVTGEVIVSAVVLGALLTTAALVIVAANARSWRRLVVVLAGFALSATLTEYATGGLENGMGMLAVVALLAVAATPQASVMRWAWVGALVAIVLLTRQDHVVLMAPFAVWLTVRAVRGGRWSVVSAGIALLVPLVVWFTWARAYYGRWLPNTFDAKLNVDIPRSELLVAGIRYLAVSAEFDPVMVVLLGAAVVTALVSRSPAHLAAMGGAVLYLGYVVWIGGDFMAGRFFTAPLVIALWTLATAPGPPGGWSSRLPLAPALWMAALLFVVALRPMVIERPSYDSPQRWAYFTRGGIADEGGFNREGGGSLTALLLETGGEYDFPDDVYAPLRLWQLRRLEADWHRHEPPPRGVERRTLAVCGSLGRIAMAGGPSLHVIDTCALADPFLAQIRWRPAGSYEWRIGHFERSLPAGYVEAVRFADAERVEDPELRALLERTWERVR